jgi:hypothetical protein|tara:strand:- start:372 stop:1103 length:732 start_codon:yes stop_codon:yes gene_type:complete
MKFFGKLITKMLKGGSTPKQIAKAAAEKGGTKATLKASLAKFVDPNKVKVGNKMMAFMPAKKQEVVKEATKGAGAGSKKLKEVVKKTTTPKKKVVTVAKKSTTPKKKVVAKKPRPLQGQEGGAKIRLGKWLTENKDKDGAALYQAFKKDYPNATKGNIESALGNIIDKKKQSKANMIYKSLPNANKNNPGTTSKNVKKAMSGGMVKRPYGGKVYDPNKRIKRMGGGQIGHNGNDEVSRLYTTH